MAHPVIRSTLPRVIVLTGLAGSLLMAAGPAHAGVFAGSTWTTCDGGGGAVGLLDPVCSTVVDVVEDVVGVASGVVGVVEEATAPVTAPVIGPVEDVVAPIADQLGDQAAEVLAPLTDVVPVEEDPVSGGGEGVPGQGVPGDDAGRPAGPGGADAPAGQPSTGGTGAPAAGEEGKVEAVGKAPSEVTEPQGPAAGDGRVAGGPALQPTDLGALGGNIAGISSQTGLNLQPYDAAPMVSVPTTTDVPQVAGAPVTTASPVAAFAAEAFTLAGDVVLPQTAGQAALVTVAGLGMLASSGVILRRRFGTPNLAVLDGEIF